MGSAISDDGRRFLTYRISTEAGVWSFDVRTQRRERITGGEGYYLWPVLGPGKKWIAVSRGDKDPLNQDSPIYLIDLATKGRQRMTPQSNVPIRNRPLRWSPDAKRIAYVSRLWSEWPDSDRVYVLNVDNPKPTFIHKGKGVAWVDNDHILVFTKQATLLSSISRGATEPFFKDSTFARPVLGGSHILYQDLRSASEGVWMVPANAPDEHDAELLIPGGGFLRMKLDADRKVLYFLRSAGEVWKIELQTRKISHVASIREMDADFDVSDDGTTIVFTPGDTDWRCSMIVTENLFE